MRVLFLILAVIGLAACSAANASGPTSGLMQVDSVEVQIAESMPPQVFARVQGTLGDGCTSLGEITQQRSGSTVEITITTQHSGAEVCTMIAQLFDETIRLDGTFAPGDYVVQVNGVERTFSI